MNESTSRAHSHQNTHGIMIGRDVLHLEKKEGFTTKKKTERMQLLLLKIINDIE